jgi:hypothetical protein
MLTQESEALALVCLAELVNCLLLEPEALVLRAEVQGEQNEIALLEVALLEVALLEVVLALCLLVAAELVSLALCHCPRLQQFQHHLPVSYLT